MLPITKRDCLHSRSTSLAKPLKCKLCGEDLATIADIRDHLIRRLHMDRELDIGFDYNQSLQAMN